MAVHLSSASVSMRDYVPPTARAYEIGKEIVASGSWFKIGSTNWSIVSSYLEIQTKSVFSDEIAQLDSTISKLSELIARCQAIGGEETEAGGEETEAVVSELSELLASNLASKKTIVELDSPGVPMSSDACAVLSALIQNEKESEVLARIHNRCIRGLNTLELSVAYSDSNHSYNFTEAPGCYSFTSPIVGSRRDQLDRVCIAVAKTPALASLENMLHKGENIIPDAYAEYASVDWSVIAKRFPYILTLSMKEQAEPLAQKYFASYIRKYSTLGLTTENAMYYGNQADPILSFIGSTGFVVCCPCDGGHRFAAVSRNGGFHLPLKPEYFPHSDPAWSPPSLTALHEFMHIEEGARIKDVGPSPIGYELIPTLSVNILIADEVYKECMGLPVSAEADYGERRVGKMPLGLFANVCRDFQRRFGGDLSLAVTSKEFETFLNERVLPASSASSSSLSTTTTTPSSSSSSSSTSAT